MLDRTLAGRVRLLVLDVDGVLTDNAVYLGPIDGARVELKRFDISDGLGIVLMRSAGIPVAWISGRHSEATTLRANELRVDHLVQVSGPKKVAALDMILAERGIGWDAVAFVGDDLADLPVMRRVGLPIAVANAVEEIRACAAYVTAARGGSGAVREAIEAILKAQGRWAETLGHYLGERGEGDD